MVLQAPVAKGLDTQYSLMTGPAHHWLNAVQRNQNALLASPVPFLVPGKVEDILGQLPLFPFFLDVLGSTNYTSIIANK